MTKSIIAIFAITSILLSVAMMAQEAYAPPPQNPEKITVGPITSSQAIPDWVDQNFRWYGEGLIGQGELINALEFLVTERIILLPSMQTAEAQEITQIVSELQKQIDKLEAQIAEIKTQATIPKIGYEEQQMKFPEDEIGAELEVKPIPPEYSLTTYVKTIKGDATNGFSDPLIAKCDKGDVATGGGFQSPHYMEFPSYHVDLPVGWPNPTGWQLFSPTTVPGGVKVWVVCLDITPDEFAK